MATRDPVTVQGQLHPITLIIEWSGLALSDDANWSLLSHYQEKCLHVYGTWGGAILSLMGSNESAPSDPNSVILVDHYQNEIVMTENGLKRVLENPLYVKPLLTGGDGTTNLTVRLACRA